MNMQTFRVNGQDTTDYLAVQRHIDALETAANEQTALNRDEFVADLAGRNIILASQLTNMQEHARSLTPAQFETFRASFATATPAAPFGRQGTQNGSNPAADNPAGNGNEPTEKETLEEIVANHRRSGMSQEKIEKTLSWKKLQALGASK